MDIHKHIGKEYIPWLCGKTINMEIRQNQKGPHSFKIIETSKSSQVYTLKLYCTWKLPPPRLSGWPLRLTFWPTIKSTLPLDLCSLKTSLLTKSKKTYLLQATMESCKVGMWCSSRPATSPSKPCGRDGRRRGGWSRNLIQIGSDTQNTHVRVQDVCSCICCRTGVLATGFWTRQCNSPVSRGRIQLAPAGFRRCSAEGMMMGRVVVMREWYQQCEELF